MDKKPIIVAPKNATPKEKEKMTKQGYIVLTSSYSLDWTFLVKKEEREYYTVDCCVCGTVIHIHKMRYTELKKAKHRDNFYCINGHGQSFT